MATSEKQKAWSKDYYHRVVKPNRSLKPNNYIQYKCPLCGFYQDQLSKLEVREPEMTVKVLAGYQNITTTKIETTQEYINHLKKVVKELEESL